MRDDTTSNRAPDGAGKGADADLRGPAWVGTRVDPGERIPVAGTWELVDHPDSRDCSGHGELRALGRGDQAPDCPHCGESVTWQLNHLAPTAAAEHPHPDAPR
jgi:hypothetical protein